MVTDAHNIRTADSSALVLARSFEVNMAMGKSSVDQFFDDKVELEKESETLQRAVQVNGRYVDPWGTAHMPSLFEVLRWKMTEKNERGVRGSWKELFRFNTEVFSKNSNAHPSIIVLSNNFHRDKHVKNINLFSRRWTK